MKRFNKRGQGSAASNSADWMLALIVLVVVALVVSGYFMFFQETVEMAPGELTRALAICEQSVKLLASNPAQYCFDYKKFDIDGKEYYYNCDDLAKQVNPAPSWAKISCEGDNSNAAKYCVYLNTTKKLIVDQPVLISGKECVYSTDLKFEGTAIDSNGKAVQSN
jgi:hypothetical protein